MVLPHNKLRKLLIRVIYFLIDLVITLIGVGDFIFKHRHHLALNSINQILQTLQNYFKTHIDI